MDVKTIQAPIFFFGYATLGHFTGSTPKQAAAGKVLCCFCQRKYL